MILDDVIVYICKNYPLAHELSKARLTKMVYLADWNHALAYGRQLTEIEWIFHNFGPYVDDVIDAARSCPAVTVERTVNFYGDPKELVTAKSWAPNPMLPDNAKRVIDKVMNETRTLYWDGFIKMVYSTPPIAKSDRYTKLDLVNFAKQENSHFRHL